MWKVQLLLLGHYKFHALQFQAEVEVQPIVLEESIEVVVLEEQVDLPMLVVPL